MRPVLTSSCNANPLQDLIACPVLNFNVYTVETFRKLLVKSLCLVFGFRIYKMPFNGISSSSSSISHDIAHVGLSNVQVRRSLTKARVSAFQNLFTSLNEDSSTFVGTRLKISRRISPIPRAFSIEFSVASGF